MSAVNSLDPDSVTGVITADPTKSLQHGESLGFKPTLVTTDFAGITAPLRNWDFFEGLLLSISFSDGNHHFVEGSAVLVAPGIALCAAHVLKPRIPELMGGATGAMCQGLASHGMLLWHLRKVTEVPDTDIMILGLELASALPPDNLFLQAVLTTRTPKIGEQLLVCGFRAAAPAFAVVAGAPIEHSGEVRVSRGPVTNHFPRGRDTAMIRWPTIEVACPARGGMSGGPVFDNTGHLIGLVCSSVDISENEGVTYISLLWPALTTRFENEWLKGVHPSPTSLVELDPRVCGIERREAVRPVPRAGGVGHYTQYTAWEE